MYNQEQTFDFEGGVHMNYKELIISLIDELDEARLKNVYFFIRGILGLR